MQTERRKNGNIKSTLFFLRLVSIKFMTGTEVSMTSKSTFLVQIPSAIGNQARQQQFEQHSLFA